MSNSIMFLVITLLFLARSTSVRAAGNMQLFAGVCDGRKGDNLPSWNQTVSLYKKMNIGWIRFYEPYPNLQKSLEGTKILVAIGPKNEDIKRLSDDYHFALNWVTDAIASYNVNWIIVGNDVIQGDIGPYVLDAIKNIRKALGQEAMKVMHITTALSTAVLTNSYLPSAAVFKPEVTKLVTEIVSDLTLWYNTPLMVNVHPYFAYAADPSHISLEYATFRSTSPVVRDGNYNYTNMFDATVDSFNAALEKIGYGGLEVHVAETGWPTRGNPPYTSVENARAYNQGLFKKLTTGIKGTPRRPDVAVVTFFYEMFNENMKEKEVEKSFGLFNPNMVPVYDMWNQARP